jgi:hypothetical protein
LKVKGVLGSQRKVVLNPRLSQQTISVIDISSKFDLLELLAVCQEFDGFFTKKSFDLRLPEIYQIKHKIVLCLVFTEKENTVLTIEKQVSQKHIEMITVLSTMLLFHSAVIERISILINNAFSIPK